MYIQPAVPHRDLSFIRMKDLIQHDSQGCEVKISLDCSDTAIRLVVADDGIGLSEKELRELNVHPTTWKAPMSG